MKIGILIFYLHRIGGLQRESIMEAEWLGNRGYDVTIIANKVDEKSPLLKKVKIEKVKIHPIDISPMNSAFNLLVSAFSPPVELKKYDLIFSRYSFSHPIAHVAKRRYGVKHIIFAGPSLRSYQYWKITKSRKGTLLHPLRDIRLFSPLKAFSKKVILSADKIIVWAQYVGEQIAHVYGRNDCMILYPSVNLEKFRGISTAKVKQIAAKYEVNRYTILNVSRHHPQKGIHWIPIVLKALKKQIPKANFILVGSTSKAYTEKVLENARKLGVHESIRICGVIKEEELVALYKSCNVMFFPAIEEGFGIVLVEAMAGGCIPVAWNDNYGPSEIIQHAVNGFLIKPYDLNMAAKHLSKILVNGNLRKKIGRNCIERSRTFSAKRHIDILEKAIQNCL